MIIVSTDMILARALAVIAEEAGFSDIKICADGKMPEKFDFAIVDADSTSISVPAENTLTISADKSKGTDILCPFSENDVKNTLLQLLGGSREQSFAEGVKAPILIQNTLKYKNSSVTLTPKELLLFRLLYENQNRCVVCKDIINVLDASQKSAHFLTVYISGLRRKLTLLFGFNILCSVRGRGYVLQTDKLKVNND